MANVRPVFLYEEKLDSEVFPLVGVNPGLVEDTAECADGNLVFSWDDCGICALARHACELYVTTFLRDFLKPCRFQAALDLAKCEWFKPRQYPLLCDG